MDTLHERITKLCREKGVSGSKMCLDLGLSKSVLSDMKHGRTKGISIPTAQKMAAYLNVSVDRLLGEEKSEENKKDPNPANTELESKLLDLFRGVPDGDKEMLVDMIEAAFKNKNNRG